MSARAAGRTRRFRSLKVSEPFKSFVLDQLEELGDVASRSMFGGIGLYRRGVFFGLIASDVLYLKVDDTTRSDYEKAEMQAFRPYPGRMKGTSSITRCRSRSSRTRVSLRDGLGRRSWLRNDRRLPGHGRVHPSDRRRVLVRIAHDAADDLPEMFWPHGVRFHSRPGGWRREPAGEVGRRPADAELLAWRPREHAGAGAGTGNYVRCGGCGYLESYAVATE